MSSQHELTGGAETGEPEVSVAVEQPISPAGASTTTPEAAPAGDQVVDGWENVRKLDWDKIPADIRARAELPHLQRASRIQQQAFEQNQAIIDALAAKTGPPLDGLESIKARVREGDTEAIIEMLDKVIERQVAPVLSQNTLKAQIEDAELRIPQLRDREFQHLVGQVIQNDPVARELVQTGGHRFASIVIQQAARNILFDRQTAELTQARAGIEAAKRQAVVDHQKMVAGLPGKSTLAGTTASRNGHKSPDSMRESALQAWLASGGRSDEFK